MRGVSTGFELARQQDDDTLLEPAEFLRHVHVTERIVIGAKRRINRLPVAWLQIFLSQQQHSVLFLLHVVPQKRGVRFDRVGKLPQAVGGTTEIVYEQLLQIAAANAARPRPIMLPAKKSIIASRLSLTPEYFSRTLHELITVGAIAVDGRQITVLDAGRLRDSSH